ncbi:uncharacterized protein B0I36DRAFT_104209 [Microdochium trichocladiopsis]|uniref:Rhodopsin domain-containing protein n=1 Tax=Microdochium trichocladiopsis TaxID=1682393 RepID=A0A9P8Y932_9PEZI|nr:uncharacterized protein B0I36DRAFT_104209 [Microdochium trichocladiopsis]KAH7033035.1 hypothetical protein B0I36DRAFT_104209 [Microdochium trichocladiopsis]
MASQAEIHSILTSYNNLGEPMPTWNRPGCVYGLTITFMALATICVVLRIYARIKQHCIGWDDYTLMATRVAATACSIAVINSVSNGLGQHFSQLGMDTMIAFQKDFYVALLTYIVSTTLVKMCFLTQYFRIFQAGTQTRIVCWICLVISALWGTAFFVISAAPCVPLAAFFDWTIEADCYGYGSRNYNELFATFVAHSSLNSLLDLVVLAIPLPMYLKKKTTSWKQRASIASMFSFGLVVFGISIWRLQSIIEHRAATWPVMDPTWYACSAIVLAVVEVDMASMCASIPVFWPILQDSWGKIFVTQEVEVVHESRISSETEQGSVHGSDSSQTRAGSEFSFKLLDVPKALQAPPRAHYGEPFSENGKIPRRTAAGSWEVHAMSESQVTSQGQQGFAQAHEKHQRSASRAGSTNGARYSPKDFDKETAANLGGRADTSQTFYDDMDHEESQATMLTTKRSWPHLLQRSTREQPTPRWLV